MGSTRRTLLLFLVLSFAHLLLMSVQMQARSGVPLFQAGAFGVFAAIQRVIAGGSDTIRSGWSNYVALQGVVADNDALQKKVLSLEGQVQTQAAIVSQTRALEQLLNLQQSLVAQTLAARVIAGDPAPGAFVITIDRGSADGVEPNMAVLGHAGVIGRVINRPTAHAAQVQLLIGHNAGVGGVTEMSEAVGPVKGGAGDPPLEMAYVDLLKDVRVGERVLTSGLDGIFPRGFVIGTIERVVKGSGVYSEIAVRPAVDFSNISMVLVMLTRPARAEGGLVKFGRVLLTVLVALTLQMALARFAVGGRWVFDFVLVAVVYGALLWGPVSGMWIGTLGGLMQDALSEDVIGVGGFAKTVVGFGVGLLGLQFLVARPLARAAAVAAATVVHRLIVVALWAIADQDWKGVAWAAMLMETGLNAAAGLAAFHLAQMLPGAVRHTREGRRSPLSRRRW